MGGHPMEAARPSCKHPFFKNPIVAPGSFAGYGETLALFRETDTVGSCVISLSS